MSGLYSLTVCQTIDFRTYFLDRKAGLGEGVQQAYGMCPENGRTPLANSPDWLKSAPMQENLLASWRQSGQKQDHCPSLLNHNAKYKRLLPPYCDFANGVPTWSRPISRSCTSSQPRAGG